MSVQAGILNLDGAPVHREQLNIIARRLAEYGPDGESMYLSQSAGMLYRPYHTTPESRSEQQPYRSDGGKIITWDGRLDNREELIFELRDQLRNDRTDVAIIAAALDRWDTSCFSRILGDWAVAIWNPRDQELILARDYAGIKHLFFRHSHEQWVWCSHLGPLAFGGDQFVPCDEFVAGYLAFQPDANVTPFRQIQSVPPGSSIRIRRQVIQSQSYWEYTPSDKPTCKTDAEYEEQFRYLFRQAVRSRLRTDGSVLADLSGGLDSSSVVCVADDIRTHEGQTPILDTFSFFDPEEPDEDDVSYLTQVELQRGRTGHHAALTASGDSFVLRFHEPSPTPGFGVRQELQAAKSSVIASGNYRVLLSGNGGDQMLGQSFSPEMVLGDLIRQRRGREFAREVMASSLSTRCPATQLLRNSLSAIIPTCLRPASALPLPWINPNFARQQDFALRVASDGIGPSTWLPSARLRWQQLLRLQGELTYSAARPQETRYPFLDRRVVEFLLDIPASQLFRSGERRSLLRRALVGFVPQQILQRYTKSGTGRCNIATLIHHWEDVETLLRAPLSAELGYIDGPELRRALMKLKRGLAHEYVGQLLRALFLEAWLEDLTSRGVLAIAPPPWVRPIQSQKALLHGPGDPEAVTAPSDLRLLAELSNSKQKGGENHAL